MITSFRLSLFFIVLTTVMAGSMALGFPADYSVVINEIHYDPDVKTELIEFVELHNTTAEDIDLSGWYFRNGISYRFGAGATLPAGGYVIVAQNPAHIQAKWSSARLAVSPHLVFGPFEGKLDNNGENIELCNAYGDEIDQVDYQLGFPWPTVGDPVPDNQPGNGNSIQLVNPSLDNDLAGSWRSAYPTPTAHNETVYLENTPPHIRQVKHSPKQPKSGELVTVTAKITDADGVADVTLSYQVVEPGSYINKKDSQYHTNWTNVTMLDEGLNGDAIAGDDIYCVQLPGTIQVHRRLLRYRITITDNGGRGLEMMKGTASIHLHIRLRSLNEMVPLFRLLQKLSKDPDFAMSASRRAIWDETEPSRCRFPVIGKLENEKMLLAHLIRHALSALDLSRRIPFVQLKEQSFADFLIHLTTIFTDVRLNLKGPTFELRTMDSLPAEDFIKRWRRFVAEVEKIL